MIEAQFRNIPIISSDCPTGPREILINGKLGELFNVGDHKGLYNKILDYRNNKKKLNKKSHNAKNFLYRFNPILNSEKYNRLISQTNLFLEVQLQMLELRLEELRPLHLDYHIPILGE